MVVVLFEVGDHAENPVVPENLTPVNYGEVNRQVITH